MPGFTMKNLNQYTSSLLNKTNGVRKYK